MSEEQMEPDPAQVEKYQKWAWTELLNVLRRFREDPSFGPEADLAMLLLCLLSTTVQCYAGLSYPHGLDKAVVSLPELGPALCDLVNETLEAMNGAKERQP